MKLVLLKDVKHLGKVGEEIVVKGGYARNYLLPTKSALTPSEENLEIINKMMLYMYSIISIIISLMNQLLLL